MGYLIKKITVGAETTYNCYIANGTYNNIETTPMINVGSSALPYEPYTGGKPSPSPEHPQEIVSVGEGGTINVSISDSGSQSQSLTLATPNGLPGIPVTKDGNYTDADDQQWVCDEIDLERGKYVQRVVIENISGGWSLKETSDRPGRFIRTGLSNKYANGGIIALCSIASWKSWGSSDRDNRYVFALSMTTFYISPPSDISMTADELNAKLNALKDPVVVLGQLATPIERDLIPEEIAAYKALRTYGPTTVVSNDAGVHMEVTYVADTKNYIRNLEQRLSAKLVNIQSALISQKTSGGGHLTIADSSPLPVEEFSMTGKTEQMKTTGKNLLKPNDYNVYHELPLKAGTVVTLMTNGQLSEGGNIKFIGMENENVWFGINKGQTRVCHSIGNKDVKGFYNLLTKKEGLEYMLAIGDVKIFEPYSGSFPSPSPDWEQPIEITDQPITITIKGGTEQQSITLTPPRPFTKWDKLEKVNGAWCWVYQSAYTPSYSTENIATEYYSTTGELSAGAEVYYKTDVPENIPLTPSEQAQLNALTMYAPETEITNNGGCTMDLTYTADTKTYIDNKLAAISAAMIGGT